MSPWSRDPECSNFFISNQLLGIDESPLSRPPSYSVKNGVNNSASNRTGYSLSHPLRNPESHVGGNPASYWMGYSPEYPASYGEGYRDSNSAVRSADSPENYSESSSESTLPGNLMGNSQDCWESYPADSLAGCSWDSRCGSVNRSDAGGPLLQFDDLPDGLCLSLRLGFSHKVHARCQRANIVRPRFQVQHLPSNRIRQPAWSLRPVACGSCQQQHSACDRWSLVHRSALITHRFHAPWHIRNSLHV